MSLTSEVLAKVVGMFIAMKEEHENSDPEETVAVMRSDVADTTDLSINGDVFKKWVMIAYHYAKNECLDALKDNYNEIITIDHDLLDDKEISSEQFDDLDDCNYVPVFKIIEKIEIFIPNTSLPTAHMAIETLRERRGMAHLRLDPTLIVPRGGQTVRERRGLPALRVVHDE
jgi:hypothetical protein